MQKTVRLALKAFPTVPASVENPLKKGEAVSEIPVDLADLYLHYYIQSFDMTPPNPDPAHFEHVRYLEPCKPFRFQANGLGANKTKKQNSSNELGEAFCRWFLDRHLDISFVARIDDVRDHGALANANGVSVVSNATVEGDAPDYFCLESNGQISLAEAKGTIEAVGFGTKKFGTWRKQFDRVRVLDPSGTPMSVKGYIVAMRWAVHTHSANIFTTLSAEDPQTPGETRFFDETGSFAAAIRSLHYAPSLAKMRQLVMSAALQTGTTIAPELRIQAVIWESFLPALKGLRFVGGYFPTDPNGELPVRMKDGEIGWPIQDPFRLDVSPGTFTGIEESIFRRLVDVARRGPTAIYELPRLERKNLGFSGASLLRDGHVIGPVELFWPVGIDLL